MKKLIRCAAVLASASLVLTACGGGSSDETSKGESVKIGVVLPYTGVQAAIAKLEGIGAEVAAKEINDKGGIAGKWKIDLVKGDDQLKPGSSAQVMRDLNDDGVGLVVGGQTSDLCKSSAEAANRFNMLFVGAHCTSPDLVDPPVTPNFFMTGQQVPDLALAMAKGLAKQYPDIETWDVVGYDVEAMRLGWKLVHSNLEKNLGRKVAVGEEFYVPVGGTSLRNEISALSSTKDKEKRGLFLAVYGAGTTSFIQQAKPTGIMEEYGALAQVGVYWPTAVAMDGDAPSIYDVHDYFYDCQSNPENDAFVSAFEKSAGQKPETGAYQGYVAVKAVAAAIEKADSTDSKAVIEAMEGLSFMTPAGKEMTIDAKTHAGTGAVTTARISGDKSAPDTVAISQCDVFSVNDLR